MIEGTATKSTNSVLDKIQYYDLKKYLLENNISNNYLRNIHSFILCLPDGEFEIVNLIRIVPKRRLVLLAKDLAKNKNVIIKLFFNNRKYHKDYKLLTDGYNLLIQHGLLTPKIIFSNLNFDLKQAYVITEYIKSHDFAGLYVKALADLHKNFLYQKDLHLNNFLIDKNNHLYYLDCETIVYNAKLISSKKAYDNFALFLTQIKNTSLNQLNDYIKQYLNFLNITSAKLQLDINNYICQSASQQLNTAIRKFIVKTRRNCTDYVVLKQKNINFFTNRKFYNLHEIFFDEFIASPDKFIDKYKVNILKQGNTAHVYLINYHGLKLVIKNYLYRSIFKKIKYLFKNPAVYLLGRMLIY